MVLAEPANVYDLGVQTLITVGALLLALIPLWFSQRRLHEKQDAIAVTLEEPPTADGPRPTLGSIARDTHARITSGFAHEQDVHDDIRAEVGALRSELEAIRAEVRANGNGGP